MATLTRNPQNTNIIQPTKFLLTFSRIDSVQYFCQSVNLPGVSVPDIVRNTPILDVYSVGNKLTFSPLSIEFLVDEDLVTWKSLLTWFYSIANPNNLTNRGNKTANYSDGSLTLLTNLNNSNLRIHFYNLFPTSLGDINFDTKLSADDIITASATFRYDYYEILTA
jgi:hypothetical protein